MTFDKCTGCKVSINYENILFVNKITENIYIYDDRDMYSLSPDFMYIFGANKRVSIDDFDKWIDDPYEKHYKNLDYDTKYISENKNNNIISLKTCLKNILYEYQNTIDKINDNDTEDYRAKLCDICLLLLRVTGTLYVCKSLDPIIHGDKYYICEYFNCIRCEKPTITKNSYNLQIHNDYKNQYIITNNTEYIDYEDTDIANKYVNYNCKYSENFSVCSSCFAELAKNKHILYHNSYYHDLMVNTNTIKCYSCNISKPYEHQENRRKINKHYFYYKDILNTLHCDNFENLIIYNKNNMILCDSDKIPNTINKEIEYVYKCSNNFSYELKINYLNIELKFLLEYIPKELCILILDYLVLYYNICNNCVSNKKTSNHIILDAK